MIRSKFYLVGIFIIALCVFIPIPNFINNSEGKELKSNALNLLTTNDAFRVEWYQVWGGNYSEYGRKVALDLSGSVYVVGFTWSFGEGYADMCLVKYDNSGNQQWNRTWGGTGFDYGNAVAIDTSGDVYIAGYTDSFSKGYNDMCLVKYDKNGIQQWNCTWGGAGQDFCNALAIDLSNNVYLAGHSDDNIVLVKYNENGVQQWNCTWDSGSGDYGWDLAIDSLGNLYIAGTEVALSEKGESHDMILIKYDENGIQQWNRTWGGAGDESGEAVVVDSSDNVYLAGGTESFGVEKSAMVLIKYNNDGILQWNHTWDTNNPDFGYGVAVDSLNSIYLTGSSGNFAVNDGQTVLVKYDGNGVQQWNCTWGGDKNDESFGIIVDSSGNIYLTGDTESFGTGDNNMILVKFSSYTEPKPLIPGYNLYMIIGILGIISLLLMKRPPKR
jgi:uncharacterized delta-60 repeat protein